MKRMLLIAFLPEASFTSRFSLSTSVYRFLRHLFFPGNIFYIQRILTPFFYMCSFTHFSVSHSLFCSFPSSSCSPGYFTFSLTYNQKPVLTGGTIAFSVLWRCGSGIPPSASVRQEAPLCFDFYPRRMKISGARE